MSETEFKAGVSAEAKSAAAEFLTTFTDFKDSMSKQINDMGVRMEALDRKSTDTRRVALATGAEVEAPHAKAMASYIRKGDEDGLRSLKVEIKGLNTAVDAEGGFLVDPQTAEGIEFVLTSGASIRALSRVVQVEAGTYDVLIDHNELDTAWNAEGAAIAETTGPIVDRISIPLHELSASPTASQRILDDSAFDIETWLGERIGERFLRAESEAFVSGDGVNKPTGFLTKPTVAEASGWAWGSIGYVTTGTGGDFDPNNPADALVDLVYALNAEYREGAAFVMNSKTAGEVRKMKDNQGRFLWMDGLQATQPPLSRSECSLPRHWRVGPADVDVLDPTYQALSHTPSCAGLRPFAPAHLKARRVGGDLALSWIRTTRIGGDSLEAFEVPQSDLPERYLLSVHKSGELLRQVETDTPAYMYQESDRLADGASGTLLISVQQFSTATGYGSKRTLEIDV